MLSYAWSSLSERMIYPKLLTPERANAPVLFIAPEMHKILCKIQRRLIANDYDGGRSTYTIYPKLKPERASAPAFRGD